MLRYPNVRAACNACYHSCLQSFLGDISPAPDACTFFDRPCCVCACLLRLVLCPACTREQVTAGFSPKYESSHERLLASRGVERCLAEVTLVWSTARLLEATAPPETKTDFIFHLRALLEHAPARDRHEASILVVQNVMTSIAGEF